MLRIEAEQFGTTPTQITEALEKENIESRPVWTPMHMQVCFANNRVVGGKVAENIFETGLCVPSGTIMTEDDVIRVCDIIKST